jgi:2-polyprenyl-3-methyl-5-hydroxy-6-metoxy-1,4-benzoquinol methylase
MAGVTMRDALRLYAKHPLFIRRFVRFRSILSPLEAIEEFVPEQGKILDLGCGHGLFTNYMALKAPARELLGVDPSLVKIQAARLTEPLVPNIRYLAGDINSVDDNLRFDAITIVDVLYLLPEAGQKKILQECRRRLVGDGILVLKTHDTRPKWRYWWARFEESIMVSLHLTQGSGIHFMAGEQTRRMLEEAGFSAEQHKLPSRIFYSNIVFICRVK